METAPIQQLLEQAKRHYQQAQYAQAEQIAQQLLAQNLPVQTQAEAHNILGICSYLRSSHQKALMHYQQAEKLLQEAPDTDKLAAFINQAILFSQTQQYEKSLAYYQKGLDLEPHNSTRRAQIINGIGNLYFIQRDYQKALGCFSQAADICGLLKEEFGCCLTFKNIAACGLELGRLDLCAQYLQQAQTMRRQERFRSLHFSWLLIEIELYIRQGEDKKAFKLLQKNQTLANNQPNLKEKEQFYLLFCQVLEKLKRWKLLCEQMRRYHQIEQELNNTEQHKIITNLQWQYETEKQNLHIQKLESQQLLLKNQYMEAELKAIKTQMNPHFISNILQSIQAMVYLQQPNAAIQALQQFGELSREILQQSASQTVSLEQELRTLVNYTELEKLHIGQDFSLEISSDIAQPTQVRIPSLLLQPLVENAILHGLRHKIGEKKLEISCYFKHKKLIINIQDNGIGRKASAQINQKRQNHQSFAGKALKKRLEIINQQGVFKIKLSYRDLRQPATGTIARVCIEQL